MDNKTNNKYIYVLDYSFSHIYEIKISNQEFRLNLTKIPIWLYKNYHIKENNMSYMVSNTKLEIETINKI